MRTRLTTKYGSQHATKPTITDTDIRTTRSPPRSPLLDRNWTFVEPPVYGRTQAASNSALTWVPTYLLTYRWEWSDGVASSSRHLHDAAVTFQLGSESSMHAGWNDGIAPSRRRHPDDLALGRRHEAFRQQREDWLPVDGLCDSLSG